jgi:GTP 3',8-cyclase
MAPLLDKFGRVHKYLRISLTERCNLKCNYCAPEGEVSGPTGMMTASEIGRLAGIFTNRCGVTKIRFTGGEPLVRKDFHNVLEQVRNSVPKSTMLCITTNGVHLKKYLPIFEALNLSKINVSVDTLDPGKFELISNVTRSHWDRTMAAVAAIMERPDSFKLKINTVAMTHVNDDEFGGLVRRFTEMDDVELRFIELMPFSGNQRASKLFIDKESILEKIKAQLEDKQILSEKQLENNSSAGRNIFSVSGHVGRFGIISSISDAFCGTCDRVRLTADGHVRNCLFSSESSEGDLLGLLRKGASNEEIEYIIRGNVDLKFFAHGGNDSIGELADNAKNNRSMIRLGG